MRNNRSARIARVLLTSVAALLPLSIVGSARAYDILPSPPVVSSPIHECAKAVHVWGFEAHSLVRVYKNDKLVGEARPPFSFADIALSEPVAVGDKITADQIEIKYGNEYPSPKSLVAVTVTAFSGAPGKPKIDGKVYECGHIVPVADLTESVTVKVSANSSEIGSAEAPEKWVPVGTSSLVAAQSVTAVQMACTTASTPSDPISVTSSPTTLPVPKVVTALRDADSIMVTDFLTGALVRAYDGSTVVGEGYATGTTNWVPLSITLNGASSITVTQELCTGPTTGATPATIIDNVPQPVLVEPIYAGQQFVFVRNVLANATVSIMYGPHEIARGGGTFLPDGSLLVPLARPAIENENLRAVESFGSVERGWSNTVRVLAAGGQPTTTDAFGGEPFYTAETNDGEQQIDAPVYPRGRGDGPTIRAISTSCSQGVAVEVKDPKGTVTSYDAIEEILPGYFTVRLGWASLGGGSVPDGIPVGKYTLTATNRCNNTSVQKSFYVIFDPKEVDAADRFGFNETGVWFATGTTATRGLSYNLHIDDKRVFDKAIGAVSGMTDQYEAVKALLTFEEGMFDYSLNYHGQDVLNLMASSTDAQCADDANMLTALLRSVGIPAHPTTADAALETGAANWTFDTWTEARVKGPDGLRWYAMHPHEQLPPTTRISAGTWGVANKGFNDIVVMANENWVSEELDNGTMDVRFHYDQNTTCHEPAEEFDYRAPWIDHLCIYPSNDHYWSEGHWECSPGYFTDLTINVLGTYWVGSTVYVNVSVANPTATKKEGTLTVTIAADNFLSKFFPDAEFNMGGLSISIPAGGNETYALSYTLPVNISGDDNYAVVARAEYLSSHDKDTKMAAFAVQSLYDVALELPQNLHSCPSGVDCSFTAKLRTTNLTSTTITNLDYSIPLPFGVQTQSGGKQVSLHENELAANAVIERTLTLKVVDPDEAANFVVNVTSTNGGLARKSRTVEIGPAGPTMFTPAGSTTTNRAPVAVCRNVTVNQNSCSATVSPSDVDNGSYDPDGPTPTCTITPSGPLGIGSTSVKLTCVDAKGASGWCNATVTVLETTAPTIQCPVSVKVPCANAAGAPATFTVSGADNCGVKSTTCTKASGSDFPLGSTETTCTVTDLAGNTASCSFFVTVELGDDPICCPAGTNVILGDSNNNVLNGTAGSDCILGRGGQDTINGNGGDDYISGGDGDDVISGGTGADLICGGTGQDVMRGDVGNDIMLGGDGDDTLRGGDGNDTLLGGQGQDKLYGENQNDTLVGEDGDDRLEGGAGDDYLIGGGLHDICIGGTGTTRYLACEVKQ